MALSDRLKNRPAPALTGSPCSIARLIDKLQGAELDALVEMLGTSEERGWPAGAIYDALVAEGHSVSYQQINRHRGGKCRCVKAAA